MKFHDFNSEFDEVNGDQYYRMYEKYAPKLNRSPLGDEFESAEFHEFFEEQRKEFAYSIYDNFNAHFIVAGASSEDDLINKIACIEDAFVILSMSMTIAEMPGFKAHESRIVDAIATRWRALRKLKQGT